LTTPKIVDNNGHLLLHSNTSKPTFS